jgi:predicted RNase H-like HicB family nuclease
MKYQVEIAQTDTGYSAYSPDVPGVGVAGSTRAETLALLEEAIDFHREGDHGDPVGIPAASATPAESDGPRP